MGSSTRHENSGSPGSPRTTVTRAERRRPFFLQLAVWLLMAVALAAPWIAGTQTIWSGVTVWLGLPMVLSFICVAIARRREIWPLSCSKWLLLPVVFLLGCLGWWATQDDLPFATAFSAEHWAFLQQRYPVALSQLPRGERLLFPACALLGLLAAVELGGSAHFRRRLALIMGVDGVVLAVYALGKRWMGWPELPWVFIGGDTEQFNVAFFHHSGPGACLDLAWPLLVFFRWHRTGAAARVLRIFTTVLVLAVVAATLPLWHSQSAPAIAAGLVLSGLAWLALERFKLARPRLLAGAIAGIFLLVFAWQFQGVDQMRANQPDGWISAEVTSQEAPARDAVIRARALLREDHMVPSPAPPRPAAWLTAARMAADYPFIGLGPGTWVKRSALYTNETIVNTFYQHRQFAHHDLLQTAAEWGGLAALAWLVIWAGAFLRATARNQIGITLALLGMGLHSQVHFPLQNPALQLWTALLLGLAWSAASSSTPGLTEKSRGEHAPSRVASRR